MKTINFTALDFETATREHNSICQIGIVVVKNGFIYKKYSSLIKPPLNEYEYHNINVHHIHPEMTLDAEDFRVVWRDVAPYITNQHLVCHNANFDLTKLEQTLSFYDIPVPDFTYSCTYEIFGAKLNVCCQDQGIILSQHHDALADAEACASLYLKYLELNQEITLSPLENTSPWENKRIQKQDLVPDFNVENTDTPFYQKKVVFTGDLVNFKRSEAAHRIKMLGADVNTSISKKTDLVIIGRNPGPSKLEKIEKLGIPIISEDEFLKMI